MLVDDHPVVRSGIAKFIEKEDDFTICGEAEDAASALDLIASSKPDIIIVDISLKGNISGIELIKSINEKHPGIHSLVLSMFEESVYAERAIRAGARGYVQKSEATDNIIAAIHQVLKAVELFEQIMGNAALPAAIQKVKCFAVSHQHPNLPLCSHLVKITDPWLILQHRFLWR